MMTEKEIRRRGIYRAVRDVIYPEKCPFCGEIIPRDGYICDECRTSFPYDHAVERRFGIRIYSVCTYGSVKNFILSAKNDRNGAMLCFMAKAINDMIFGSSFSFPKFDMIVPMPLHILSRITRGYSQTEKICAELSYLSGIDSCKALVKTKRTKQQKELSGRERITNLKGAFALSENVDIKDKTILLIDDVSTTGSTFIQAVRALKKGGCKEVYAVCFARASKKD